jgi:dCTP deaminase
MILSNVEIHRALDDGRLIITPEPLPRFPELMNERCPYGTHSVDVTLSDVIEEPAAGPVAIDLTQPGSVADVIRRNSNRRTFTVDHPFRLLPNHFVLGNTREFVALPLQRDPDRSLAARIEGKSSRARFGLLVHFTAPTVHPLPWHPHARNDQSRRVSHYSDSWHGDRPTDF